ncbi:unnamed protein product [Ambrosiozyma monospora]|uniref:Large ribosomal subunit protein mL67 n=1 Tax=Ambrosiozyma monospora TaxID=43982 RepID=A0A9W7DJI3_AMBMO|nr:unnamed protein product [Ambrosiozyma monospora]
MASKFRNTHWLKSNGFAPQIFLFKNLESGQVVYSQTPHITQYQIKQQFFRPNWENRLPSPRRDLWRPMAVLQLESYEKATQAYHALVELRYMRQVSKRKEAEALRKRNEYSQIWYSGQFRPTWSQEATSDLSLIMDELKLENVKIYWDSIWRKGDDKFWNLNKVKHLEIDNVVGTRERFVVLDEIRKLGLDDFKKLNEQKKVASEVADSEAVVGAQATASA